MRYLLTGGAGFIGSRLAEVLLSKENSIVAIDNLSTGSRKNLIIDHDNFVFVHGDIKDANLVNKYVAKSDFIVHLAAAVGVLNIVNKNEKCFHV